MVSLCLTTYKRDSLVIEAIQQVVNDERVTEIVIVDDYSPVKYLTAIKAYCSQFPKIKLYMNKRNLGCYKNKAEAVRRATNDWVILLDSDNVITPQYLDPLFAYNAAFGWSRDTILAPDFAWPTFDYRHFSGVTLTDKNAGNYVGQKRFDCLINTANYFFHRDEYLKLHDGKKEPWTADTIYTNYNWLKAGNKIHVLPGLQYFHRTEHAQGQEKSHYILHNRKTNGLAKKIEEQIAAFK